MENVKKKKMALILIIFLTFIVISNRFVFSYAKYVYDSTRDYFLKAKGFYFYSDTLGTSTINNSNNSWDGGSVYFDFRNSLNDAAVTDYDINYDVECNIEGLAAEYLECRLMGTELDTYSGTLSAVQGCRNDTDDQVDVSNLNKTTCELNGYLWASQVAKKDIYFDVINSNSEYKISEVTVNLKVTSTSPYKKSLYGKFILNKIDSVEGNIELSYSNYLGVNKLVVSNSFNENKCLKLTWNSDHVLIGENKSKFSSFKFDENGYLNEVDFNIEPKSEITYNFYERLYGLTSDLNLIDFNVETQDEINCS